MQHLKEFLTHIQTFDLRIVEDDIQIESGTNEKKSVKAYDITPRKRNTMIPFSYKSELRVLKDMALIDLLTLGEAQIVLQLE